ncbi:hypothetical protein GN244_ATG16958 [Phytophthora infestans]|uniref:Uncharacterized protein n=1 Tax=Phytophthora infestans TaxID=4787 RepID=A0A833SKG5_PHYIN|nr:hypothetical protein GN244_ATG16958 [Phytophthora infestans]
MPASVLPSYHSLPSCHRAGFHYAVMPPCSAPLYRHAAMPIFVLTNVAIVPDSVRRPSCLPPPCRAACPSSTRILTRNTPFKKHPLNDNNEHTLSSVLFGTALPVDEVFILALIAVGRAVSNMPSAIMPASVLPSYHSLYRPATVLVSTTLSCRHAPLRYTAMPPCLSSS